MQTLFLFVKIANFGRITPPIDLQIFKKTGKLKNVTMLQKFCYHANVASCENCHFRSARTLSLFVAAQNSLCTSKSDLSCAEFFVQGKSEIVAHLIAFSRIDYWKIDQGCIFKVWPRDFRAFDRFLANLLLKSGLCLMVVNKKKFEHSFIYRNKWRKHFSRFSEKLRIFHERIIGPDSGAAGGFIPPLRRRRFLRLLR